MDIIITDEMKLAMELIAKTQTSLYITGKAGTGKTTLLKHIIKESGKRCVVTAPTGVAAINAGGQTLHSMFGIPFGPLGSNAISQSKFSEKKAQIFNSIDTVIIDEISMVRADMMDFIDRKLQIYRKNHMPFGGLQIVMFGDLFQLPPVIKEDEKRILEEMYGGCYFYHSNVLRHHGFNVVELNHIFRQSEQSFIDLLNNIREYNLSEDDYDLLCELRDKKISDSYESKHIHICTHKVDVATINKTMLGEETHKFYADIEGDFNMNSAPCDAKLLLRVGARVMVLVNDAYQRFCNGSLGNVKEIQENKILVDLDNGMTISMERYKWINYEYKMEKGAVVATEKGSCIQFPITLAWAITIHKSQGLTFDNIVIHTKGTFCPGQIYVALSRCRTLEGIISDTFIDKRHIIPEEELLRFEKAYKRNEYMFNEFAYKEIVR